MKPQYVAACVDIYTIVLSNTSTMEVEMSNECKVMYDLPRIFFG